MRGTAQRDKASTGCGGRRDSPPHPTDHSAPRNMPTGKALTDDLGRDGLKDRYEYSVKQEETKLQGKRDKKGSG